MVGKRKGMRSEDQGERRVSLRIQEKQRVERQKAEEKDRKVLERVKLLDVGDNGSVRSNGAVEHEEEGGRDDSQASRKTNRRRKVEGNAEEVEKAAKPLKTDEEKSSGVDGSENGGPRYGNATNSTEKNAHAKVKDTLRLFNKYYLHFVQEREKQSTKVSTRKCASKDGKKSCKGFKSKEVEISEDDSGSRNRPDLKALTKMKENGEILYPKKIIGELPGIEVGHQFYSRAEMCVLGLHSHWLNGIDYMGIAYKNREYRDYAFPLAVAIVLSGMYEDDLDNADDIVYTGQGGHNLTGDKRQIRDQLLERGNLALKNCVDHGLPVRVVRGHNCSSSYTGKVYTYDGLYKVAQYWAEKGLAGFTIFKYKLKRLEGQPILTTSQVIFVHGRVPRSLSEIRGLVCEDITGGQEDIPIPATNLVDNPPVAPTGFTYIKSLKIVQNVKIPTSAVGCNCKGTCVDPRICACAKRNGSDFPYVNCSGGRLIEAKDVVFECGPKCGCGLDCVNRTSQRGIRYRLEVFRTPKKGWAVRSWDFIPSGAPICEYIGVLKRTEDVDHASDNNYIFEIDCLLTMLGIGGRERRSRDVSIPLINDVERADDQKAENVPEFCIDAGSSGNIARFINHSCEPNLFVQCVLSSHQDLRLARVMLFAADNIPPLQELNYDYGYALDSVHGPDGKVKKMPCLCGAQSCRRRLY